MTEKCVIFGEITGHDNYFTEAVDVHPNTAVLFAKKNYLDVQLSLKKGCSGRKEEEKIIMVFWKTKMDFSATQESSYIQ